MAYTLKTSGIALNCTALIAVDSDGTVKDFANGSVSTSWVDGSDGAVSGVTGDVQWRSATSNGSSHKYFETSSARFIKFGATKPTIALGGTRTFFAAFADVSRNIAIRSCIVSADSSNWIGAYDYGNFAANANSVTINTTQAVGATLAGQHSIAFVTNGTTARNALYDASSVLDTYADSSSAQSTTPGYVGKRDAASGNYFAAKFFCIAQFNTNLSGTDITALNDDWFGTLLDGGGASGVAKQASFYQMLRSA